MSEAQEIGRLPAEEVGQDHILDDPTKGFQAVLTKQDEIIDLLKALTAKLDADGGVSDTDFASLLTDDLNKLGFSL